METKTIETVRSDAAFVYIDLGDSAGWERVEKLLAEPELPAVDLYAAQIDPQPAKWSRQ